MSKFLTIDYKDLIRSFLLAALTALITSIVQIVKTGAIPTKEQISISLLAALGAGVSVIIHAFVSNSKNTLGKEPKDIAAEITNIIIPANDPSIIIETKIPEAK